MITKLILYSLLFSIYITLSSTQTLSLDQWHLLHKSIGISAMHMQLLHNNKVVMFDRTDFGSSNISLPGGFCRFDPNDTAFEFDCTAHSVLYDIATNRYRPLMVQTDTWCSSGCVLPNGTLVQTGGFNDGDKVVRMFTPCNEDQTCDWIEFPQSLSQRRWYATNQILPDGRIIIVGGRRQYNYEFFPRNDLSPAVRLDFLFDTRDGNTENNLYPFVHLLPDGNLFVFANTRSILFDYKHNRVIKEFPRIPGDQPRNYPSSGSSVLLPLDENHSRNTSLKVQIMICGGAPRGSYNRAFYNQNFVHALSTCGRLIVSHQNPNWVMEKMPSPRVMGDMIILPTGDVIIINGAELGTAGWNCARDPALRPIIYRLLDKSFTVMSPSARPRMYHSTAILLPDGRVLVGGSNVQPYYNFTNVEFPTDLSLEAYSPPYLSPTYASRKPVVLSHEEVLKYKKSFSIRFSVVENLLENELSVRLVAPTFTTHSLAMSQRMVVLRTNGVSSYASGLYTLKAFGPSTAEIAPPGYYMMFVVHADVPSSGVWVRLADLVDQLYSVDAEFID